MSNIVKDVKLKRNDLQPYYRYTVANYDGTLVDLTGATITFSMRKVGEPSVLKVDNQSAIIVDAIKGITEYQWQLGDTDTAGDYEGEFEITPSGGNKFTVPVGEPGKIIIKEDINAA